MQATKERRLEREAHDILPESVFVAVENRAIQEGDVATIRDLATGKLTEQGTTMGQRIRALGERDPESPVAAIKSIIKVRTGGADVSARRMAEVAAIRKHIGHIEITSKGWTEFVDSLRC